MMDDKEFAAEVLLALPYRANDQQVAVVAALSRFCAIGARPDGVFVLNGYAGTGKTSLTGALVKTLTAHKRAVMLLAPTGRAAKVFSANSGGFPAYTIHRKIYRHDPNGVTNGWGNMHMPAENKLRDAVFIVDEASMIGVGDGKGDSLLDDLVTFVYAGEGCRLILIGDTAQLPPVGSDRSPAMNPDVLRRLGLKVTHATLTETARQAADSGILFNATRLRRTMAAITKRQAEGATGPMPIPKLRPADDVVVVTHEDLPEMLTSSYADGISDTILITLSNRRAADYNAAIRTEVLYREDEVMRDDMLIVSRNHYFGKKVGGIDFVANGDILTVVAVYGSETRYGLRFADVRLSLPVPDGEPVEFDIKILLDSLASPEAGISQEAWNALYYGLMADYGPYADRPVDARLRALRTDPYWTALHVKYAYAVTCHKAQGGQWGDVYVDLAYIPEDALNLSLYRWLYTAVTRARRTLYLIAPPDALLDKR